MVAAMWYAWVVVMLLSVSTCLAADADPPPPPPPPPAGPEPSAPVAAGDARGESHGRTGARPPTESRQRARGAELGGRQRAAASAPRTLDRGSGELAWKAWLLSPESRDAAPPRRITTKSLFITPDMSGGGGGGSGVELVTVNRSEHEKYTLEQLNALFASGAGAGTGGAGPVYDYDEPAVDAAAEPLQLTIPLGLEQPLPLVAAASQIQPSQVLMYVDKKDDIRKTDTQDAKLEAELERLKLESERDPNTNDLRHPNNEKESQNKKGPPHINFSNYPTMTIDKPKRDNTKENVTTTDIEQGQKEVVFGNVSEDTVLYATVKQTENINKTDKKNTLDPNKIAAQINNVNLETVNKITNSTGTEGNGPQLPVPAEKMIAMKPNDKNIMTTTQSTHNLKENEKPAKLHPEIDYSDFGETIKIISRYAEVTTDDTFKGEQKKHVDNNENPLGTRTRLQHKRKQMPLEPAPLPQPVNINQFYPVRESIYDDRIPSHIIYPKTSLNQNGRLGYYRYPLQNQRFAPPPHYPFRHVQDYWTRPEQYAGPYAHENPRRHRHSYAGGRARRPDAAFPARAPAPPPARDLYSLLGLRHWFSSDGAAKR